MGAYCTLSRLFVLANVRNVVVNLRFIAAVLDKAGHHFTVAMSQSCSTRSIAFVDRVNTIFNAGRFKDHIVVVVKDGAEERIALTNANSFVEMNLHVPNMALKGFNNIRISRCRLCLDSHNVALVVIIKLLDLAFDASTIVKEKLNVGVFFGC